METEGRAGLKVRLKHAYRELKHLNKNNEFNANDIPGISAHNSKVREVVARIEELEVRIAEIEGKAWDEFDKECELRNRCMARPPDEPPFPDPR